MIEPELLKVNLPLAAPRFVGEAVSLLSIRDAGSVMPTNRFDKREHCLRLLFFKFSYQRPFLRQQTVDTLDFFDVLQKFPREGNRLQRGIGLTAVSAYAGREIFGVAKQQSGGTLVRT